MITNETTLYVLLQDISEEGRVLGVYSSLALAKTTAENTRLLETSGNNWGGPPDPIISWTQKTPALWVAQCEEFGEYQALQVAIVTLDAPPFDTKEGKFS